MHLVSLESPFEPSEADIRRYTGKYTATDLRVQNMVYARMALENSIVRGESPMASSLLFPQVWLRRPELRMAARKASMEIHRRVDTVVLCADLGIDEEMKSASMNASLVGTEQLRRVLIDVADGRDPREVLAEREPEFVWLQDTGSYSR